MKKRLVSMIMVMVICITTATLQVSATEKVIELATPVVKVAAVSESKLKISWKAIENAERYYVYRRNDEGKYKRITVTSKTSLSNGKLEANTKYYYKVAAVCGSGENLVKSKTSKIASGTTKSKTDTKASTVTETTKTPTVTQTPTVYDGRTVVKSVAGALASNNDRANYITEAAIGSTKTVYIASSGSGSKYHTSVDCSKMLGTIKCTVAEAQKSANPKGVTYTACKKRGC